MHKYPPHTQEDTDSNNPSPSTRTNLTDTNSNNSGSSSGTNVVDKNSTNSNNSTTEPAETSVKTAVYKKSGRKPGQGCAHYLERERKTLVIRDEITKEYARRRLLIRGEKKRLPKGCLAGIVKKYTCGVPFDVDITAAQIKRRYERNTAGIGRVSPVVGLDPPFVIY